MVAQDKRYYLYYAFEIKKDGSIVPRGHAYQQLAEPGSEQWENLSHALLFGSYDDVLIKRVAQVEHPHGMGGMSNAELAKLEMPRVYYIFRKPTKVEMNKLHMEVLKRLREMKDVEW